MWDRVKHAKKRRKHSFSSNRSLHIKRTPVDLTVISPTLASKITVPARALLNDIGRRGLLAFTASPLAPGQELEITILEPKVLTMRGRTSVCQHMSQDRRIISAEYFPYRVAIDFEFQNQTDLEQINAYCETVQREFLKT